MFIDRHFFNSYAGAHVSYAKT